MKHYKVQIVVNDNGKKCIAIDGLILSKELKAVKEKLGDINRFSVNQKIDVFIN